VLPYGRHPLGFFGVMTDIQYLDRLPAGWFVLDVMRQKSRGCDWVALAVDVDPDDLKNHACDFPALFYVHPKEHRPGERKAQHNGSVFRGSTETKTRPEMLLRR